MLKLLIWEDVMTGTVHRQAGGLHARQRLHAIEKALVEQLPLLGRISQAPHVEARPQQVLTIEPDF